GEYYEPPIDRVGLAKSYPANPHHASALQVKQNILTSCYKPHPLLSRSDFSMWALNYLIFGDCFMERIDNMFGKAIKLKPSPSKYTRRGKNDQFFFVEGWNKKHTFNPGSICHLMEHDINQEIYGVPYYLAGLQSAWLNEAATLFRRRYYINGSHAGFIMYMTDTIHEEDDITSLRTALKEAKGPGNFRNLFMYAPGGKKDGIQIMPISEVQAKDEFFNIKNVSRDDVLASHRVPLELMSIVPANVGGFGDIEKVNRVFNRNELIPLQTRLRELNDWLGQEVITFEPYTIE
ncbi:MAG: phage portal protein, partial [Gammaproteobacteria bacterium]|nr:phage portal protein [Gammaproteobacteria bacterium]